jgi:hypothetical protein
MRWTTSPDCATGRRSLHEWLLIESRANRSARAGCSQDAAMPQMPHRLREQLGRRADLFALQEHECLAKRFAPQIVHFQQQGLRHHARIQLEQSERQPFTIPPEIRRNG